MIEGIMQAKLANVPSIITSAGTILPANNNRKGFMIQNVGTNAVFIRFGGTASDTVFHLVLRGGIADKDGNGGSYSQLDGTIYQGLISIFGATPKVVVTELTR